MKIEELMPLERKLLNEIIRPAISSPYKSKKYYKETIAQDLRFDVLLREIKDFYKSNGGKDWDRLLREVSF